MRLLRMAGGILGIVFALGGSDGYAQSEFGVSIGAANALTDLGGANDIGSPLVRDLEFITTRPAIGLLLKQNFSPFFAGRVGLYWAMLAGDDDLLNPNKGGGHLPRYQRNLDFKTHLVELTLMGEVNFRRFEARRYRYRYAPYGMLGVALFWFDPHALDGTRLKPLNTEGQGLPEYPDRKPYSLIQPSIPVGLGFKYSADRRGRWMLAFEVILHYTFTDYLDDVSKTFPDPRYFYAHMPADKAELADQYSNRWQERCIEDPEHCAVFIPGEQRGDPTDNDHYAFVGMLTFTYLIKQGQIFCPKF